MKDNYDFSKGKRNPYAKRLKKQVTIRLDEGTFMNYLSRELIESTRTRVELGTVTFMGRYVANQSLRFGDGEPIQRHFMEMFEGKTSATRKFLRGDASKRLTLHEMSTDSKYARKFLEKAREQLSSAWTVEIDQKLATLQ